MDEESDEKTNIKHKKEFHLGGTPFVLIRNKLVCANNFVHDVNSRS